jgi:endonuclease/exonuclease/phosphatase family metal-dependent hydrolase
MADLTVMTWNVQNLLPVGHEDGPATAGEYQAKLAALATIIDVVEPDVLALQEVGPAEILADLNDACAIDFDHRLVGTPDPRGIRVALMSPRRLSNRTDITAYPTGLLPVQSKDLVFDDPNTPANEALSGTVGRGVLSATVRAGGQRVTVMVAHLKSKLITYGRQPGLVGGSPFAANDEGERLRYSGYALYRRTAEAMACRAALDRVLTADGDPPGDGPGTGTQRPVVFVGDLNDEPQAATTQIIQGPSGSEIDFRSGSGFQTGDTGDGWRLWNLHRLLPPGAPNYTRIYRGRGELIDHMFASHRLVNPANLPTVDILAATPLPSVDDTPAPATAQPSDHAAVVATFHL